MNENSIAAYHKVDRNAQRKHIYALIRDAEDGLTSDDCRCLLGDPPAHSTVSARFSDLRKDGLIVARKKRPTRSGCLADVFYATGF